MEDKQNVLNGLNVILKGWKKKRNVFLKFNTNFAEAQILNPESQSSQALTIARLTHSSYTTQIAGIRCYTTQSYAHNKCVRGVYLGE